MDIKNIELSGLALHAMNRAISFRLHSETTDGNTAVLIIKEEDRILFSASIYNRILRALRKKYKPYPMLNIMTESEHAYYLAMLLKAVERKTANKINREHCDEG